MSNLIDKTYFVHEINIPDSAYSDLDAYITHYQKELLLKLLGYDLWKLVDEYDSTNPSASTQPVIDLVEGKEYQVSGYTVKWNGLKNADKISIIAYYVYYWYVRNKSVMVTPTGTKQAKGENSVPGTAILTVSQAWSRLVRLYGYPRQDLYEPSVYNFLILHYADYPQWWFTTFTELGEINAFDL